MKFGGPPKGGGGCPDPQAPPGSAPAGCALNTEDPTPVTPAAVFLYLIMHEKIYPPLIFNLINQFLLLQCYWYGTWCSVTRPPCRMF